MTIPRLKRWLTARFEKMSAQPADRFDVSYKIDLALDELEYRLCRKNRLGEYRVFARALFSGVNCN